MKIVSWNCNGALRNKTALIDALEADILIVQECEDPAHSTNLFKTWANNYLWHGTSKNKGIGVFARKNHSIKALNWFGAFKMSGLSSTSASLEWSSDNLKLFLPFSINNSFSVLAVWTKGSDDQSFRYIGQFWKYLQIHRANLNCPRTLITGDFNSNAIWDQEDRWWNHTDVINELEVLNIYSLYHAQHNQDQGKETLPTYFHHRNINKPYHIDYAFVSGDLLDASQLQVGKQEDWIKASDHMPLIIEMSD